MTDDVRDIIDRLCLLAGMLMEDASVDAIFRGASDVSQRRKRLVILRQAGADIDALLAAAEVVERRAREMDW